LENKVIIFDSYFTQVYNARNGIYIIKTMTKNKFVRTFLQTHYKV